MAISHYVLVCQIDSAVVRLCADYTELEYDFFKKLVDLIVESEAGGVSSIELLNVGAKKMRKDEVEMLLDRLNQERWIIYENGLVSLSTRAICELEQHIRETFKNYPLNCELCKKICIKGQMCDSCDVRVHVHCAIRLFSGQSERKCPGKDCRLTWPHEIPNKRRDETGQTCAVNDGASTSGSTPKKSKRH